MGTGEKAKPYGDLDDETRVAICVDVMVELRAPMEIVLALITTAINKWGIDAVHRATARLAVASSSEAEAVAAVEKIGAQAGLPADIIKAATDGLKGQ